MEVVINILQSIKENSDKAKSVLDLISAQGFKPTSQQINDLDYYAQELAKLAYGNNVPEALDDEISNLISWCDHIQESELLKLFIANLQMRPLAKPVWSTGN